MPDSKGEVVGSREPVARGSLSSGKSCSGPSKLGAWAACFLLGEEEEEGTGIHSSLASLPTVAGKTGGSAVTSEQGRPTVSRTPMRR